MPYGPNQPLEEHVPYQVDQLSLWEQYVPYQAIQPLKEEYFPYQVDQPPEE